MIANYPVMTTHYFKFLHKPLSYAKVPQSIWACAQPHRAEDLLQTCNHKKAAPGQPAPLKAINSIAPEQKTGAIREQ